VYPRITKTTDRNGNTYEYIRLVESYRENGKNKQRTVCSLGRRDLLMVHLDRLIQLLSEPEQKRWVRSEDVEPVQAWDWGPMLAVQTLWQELGLQKILDRMGGRSKKDGVALSDRVLVLVANRLCAPSSEHGLAGWLDTDYVCDREGRRWVASWRSEQERRDSKAPRVRVESKQLQQWYRTLDKLHARKERLEKELYLQLRDLFSLKVDMVLYDLTSTYFEGEGPAGIALHGHSRDKRPRNRQVLLGLVMVDGWPIAHHVFAGNRRDSTTVEGVLADLQERFGIARVVFVGDRGMVTSDNIEHIRRQQQGYVVGLNRRRSEQIYQYVERATGQWHQCPLAKGAQEKSDPPKTLVQEVPSDEPGVRVFVVHSDERKGFEEARRLKGMRRVREALERLQKRVEKGRLKDPSKIGAAAARTLARHKGYRYYQWEYKDGEFRFFEHPINLKREKAYEGKYVIQTEEPNLGPIQVVQIYKQLMEVERAFRNLKDVIELRPIYHQTAKRVEAHIQVATLAFLLQRLLEKKLKNAGIDLSASDAMQALKTVKIVDFTLGNGEQKRTVTKGSERAARVLRALDVHNPNIPPKQEISEV